MFSPDKPINKISEDILGRDKFSKELARAIVNADSKESLVVALNGTWGSGKSSVINMVEDECINIYQNKIKVVRFNPWYYSDRSNLILKFFECICAEEKIFDNIKKRKKVFEKIGNYAANFESVSSFIPYASGGVKAIKNVSEQIKKKYESRLVNIEDQQKEIRKIFSNLDYKILIIIDDIDRLTQKEIRDIFQLVKLVGDIPNIVYLLSFDREVVRLALDEFHKGKGEDYLEKIVQVQFELPQIRYVELENYFLNKIKVIFETIPKNEFEVNRWIELNRNGIRFFLKSLRHVNRYLNVLRFDYGLLKGEVNIVDFFGITAIKVFDSVLYDFIRNNKHLFLRTETPDRYSTLRVLGEKYKEDFSKLSNISSLQHYVKSILINLFPKTYEAIGEGYFRGFLAKDNTYRRKQRICSEEHFEIYFIFSLPNGFISNKEMSILMNEKNEEVFKKKLTDLNNEKKINIFLDRLADFTEEVPIEEISTYINSLIYIGDKIEDNTGKFFLFPFRLGISHIIYQLLIRIKNKNERFKILRGAFENAETSLCTIVDEIAINDTEHGRFGRTKDKEKAGNELLDEKDLDKLENIGLNLIEKCNDKNGLLEKKDLLNIIYRWKEWGGVSYVNKFLIDKSNSKKDTSILLTKLLSVSKTYKSNEYEPIYDKYFESNIKKIFNLEPIYNTVKSYSGKDIDNFTDEQKEAIELFIGYYEGE